MLIVAFALLTHHTPPGDAFVKLIFDPIQTAFAPLIAATVGNPLIVLFAVTVVVQLFTSVTEYATVVVPAVVPVNTPEVLIVAFALLTDHTPPGVAFVKLMFDPTQTAFAPLIAATVGNPLTVLFAVTVVVQLFTSVTA